MFHMKFLWAFSKIEKMRQVSVLIWVLFFVMPLWGRTITLQGRVVDADTLLPLAGATVEAGDSKSGCITDAEGNFMLSFSGELPVALTARYIGFYPTTLTVGSADTFVEIGPGKTLCGLISRIDPSVRALAACGLEQSETILDEVKTC